MSGAANSGSHTEQPCPSVDQHGPPALPTNPGRGPKEATLQATFSVLGHVGSQQVWMPILWGLPVQAATCFALVHQGSLNGCPLLLHDLPQPSCSAGFLSLQVHSRARMTVERAPLDAIQHQVWGSPGPSRASSPTSWHLGRVSEQVTSELSFEG